MKIINKKKKHKNKVIKLKTWKINFKKKLKKQKKQYFKIYDIRYIKYRKSTKLN